MKITVPGYSSITGSPEIIVKVLQAAKYFEAEEIQDISAYMGAEQMLEAMEYQKMIIIEERHQ